MSAARPLAVVHVSPSLDVSYGGPAVAIPEIAAALRPFGVDSVLISVDGPDARNGLIATHGLDWHRAAPLPVRKGYGSTDLARLIRLTGVAAGADLIHVHSFWCWPAVAAARAARALDRPLVISPHSEFYPESVQRSGALKTVFMQMAGRNLLRQAALVHGTEPREIVGARQLGYAGRTVEAQIGVDPALGDDLPDRAGARARLGLDPARPVALFLARLHPRKGVDRLIRAWAAAGMEDRGWSLAIAGDGDPAYVAELRALAGRQGGADRIHWLGHVEGEARRDAFAAAELFVLPTLFENFGLSIAEALACRLPVIATDGTPWAAIQTEGAGWILPAGDPDGLMASFTEALEVAAAEQGDGRLAARGARGRALVRDLTWDRTAGRLAEAYQTLLEGSRFQPLKRSAAHPSQSIRHSSRLELARSHTDV